MEKIRKKLYKKGWKDADIKKAVTILKKADNHPNKKRFDTILLWVVLFVLIASSFIISLMLLPILVIMDSWKLYLVLIVFGGFFGMIYSIILHDITHFTSKHYTLFSVFVFAVILVVTYYLTSAANRIILFTKYKVVPNNWIVVGIVYSLSFILPYYIQEFVESKKK